MGKAEYLARKKWEGNLAEGMEEKLAGMEAEEKGLKKRIEKLGTGRVSIMEWMEFREDKRKLLQCLIGSIDVYVGKEIAIQWNYHDRFI